MSSVEDRQNSAASEQNTRSESLHLPGLVTELSPVEQLSFPGTTPLPMNVVSPSAQQPQTRAGAGVTRPLFDPNVSSGVTRNLPTLQTGALYSVQPTTTALRQPVVIPSTGKKSKGTMRPPPKGRRWLVHLVVTCLLVLISVTTLMAVLPAGTRAEGGFSMFHSIMDWSQGSNSNPSFLALQAATVTAVTQDGYDSGGQQTYAGLPTAPPSYYIPPGSGSYDGFTYGQCTYWADYRYHALTGMWVPWGGNAWQWSYGASASGWVVSSTPHVPSIIVLQAGVQGAGGYGHVAIVEGINSDGSVHTSNWNWYANGGGWARLSYMDFFPGPGVSFVWYAGK